MPAAAAAPAASLALPRDVHLEVATAEGLVVEGADGFVRVLHLDEGEAARAARVPVRDDLHRLDLAVLTEETADLLFGGTERKIADVKLLSHCSELLRNTNLAPRCCGRPRAG